MGTLGLQITVCATDTSLCSLSSTPCQHIISWKTSGGPSKGHSISWKHEPTFTVYLFACDWASFCLYKILQWQDWNRLLALWQPGYCQEELGSVHRCYDAGSLLKGKNIEGKLEMKERARSNVRKVQKIKLVSVNTWKLFEVYILWAFGDWRYRAKNCFSAIPS